MKKNTIIALLLLTVISLSYHIWSQRESRRTTVHKLDTTRAAVSRRENKNPPEFAEAPATSALLNPPRSEKSGKITPKQFQAFGSTPEEQMASMRHGVKSIFGRAVTALKLSPQDESRVWDFLIKHSEAAYVANDIFAARRAAQEPADLEEMIAIAHSEVEADIVKAFDTKTAEQVLQILSASNGLTLTLAFDQAFNQSSEPITPEQALPVALILQASYPPATTREMLPMIKAINPSNGLMPIDETALLRLAEVLSPRQLAAFKTEKAKRNLKYLNITHQS